MSPASRSKSKDKKSRKEPQKGSSKTSGHVNSSEGIPASGYNPVLGIFHTFETAQLPSGCPIHVNGRFQNIDDTDDNSGNLFGSGIENGSWSGESEDHKEKMSQPPSRQEYVPGADNDKREKIRQKNERKHQRQKERRAQELHERCSGYLMSRKLEALAQQLVAMGFSQERATMALILNDGRLEESVAWFLDGGEDKCAEHALDGESNLKIDISEELARIADMEIRHKASKQEVERVVVACEGDLEKAEEMLKAHKLEPPAACSKPEENGDPSSVVNGKLPMAISQDAMRVQTKPSSSAIVQQQKDNKDFNYTKVSATEGPSVDPGTNSMQVLKKLPPKLDWAQSPQVAVPAEKSWSSAGSNPSISYSSASHLQSSLPPANVETCYVTAGNELKNLQLGSVNEQFIVMQRPQSINAKLAPNPSFGSSPPGTAMGWYPKSVDAVKSNGLVPPVAGPRSLIPKDISSNSLFSQLQHQSQQQFLSSSSLMDPQRTTRGNGMWSREAASPMLFAASSLGLFSGQGGNVSSGSSSPVDWNTGSSMLQLDYTNVDWSLDLGSLPSRSSGLWSGTNYSLPNNARSYDSFPYGMGVKSTTRPVLSNGNGASIPGPQDGVASTESTGGGSREWSSPFEERDIFNLPRQFVSSPSL